jgi:putative hydrolase of HD superfamily
MSNDPAPAVVQRQLDAYNTHDLDALMATYSTDAVQVEFPDKILARGADEIRRRFALRFQESNLHAKLYSRMVMGNVVVDHELVTRTFPEGVGTIELMAIYEVADGRIVRASFVFGPKILAVPA